MSYSRFYFCFAFLILIASASIFAQNAQQREHLLRLSESNSLVFFERQSEAHRLAELYNLPTRIVYDDGKIVELMYFEEGIPVYYSTTNADGAALIKSDELYPDGAVDGNITGSGHTLGIWDGGMVYAEHPDLNGRVIQIDSPSSISDHSTHVAGTMMATGINPAAKGMAYEASLLAWDWNNDASEMAAAAANGLKVSQHSYSTVTGWRYGSWSGVEAWHWFGNVTVSETEDYRFGFYDARAQLWDEISYYAPNYIIVKSAGNDRGRGPSEAGTEHYARINNFWTLSTAVREVNGGEDGFDCITRNGNAKNILTVGAVDANGNMTSFSSWGPTDDGRVKPDIVAKGLDVYSSVYDDEDDYGYKSGTSMSGPMVSGSIGLLLHLQELLNPGQSLRSSTIKALIFHGADDHISGAPGPDYRFGWGLMNTKRSAEILSQNASGEGIHVKEMILSEGSEILIPVKATGDEALRATIVWTDMPGTPVSASVNPPDLMLVNDLDMRITDSQQNIYYPYILDPANPAGPATTGDNFRDNAEMIHIEEPQAEEIYTIQISHKECLASGSQAFSLIITGNEPPTNVSNPASFCASAEGAHQVNLTWTKNSNNDDVMIAWNNENIFGTPEHKTVYEAGQSIPGGGVVLYRGAETSFEHTGLNAISTYYYKAFSYDESSIYSSGRMTSEKTDCGIIDYLPFSENFNDSNELPSCWEITDHIGNGQVWQFGTHPNGLTGTTGNYAFIHSDWYGQGNTQNTDLITPVFDFSNFTSIYLSFTHFFRQYVTNSLATLSYSTDGGQSWVVAEQWDSTTDNPAFFNRAFPGLARLDNVRFKWNFTGTYAWYWNIDDIMVTGIPIIPQVPRVITSEITAITETSAFGGGRVTNTGNADVTARGMVWHTSPLPSMDDYTGFSQDGGGLGSYTSTLADLMPATTYYARAYASNIAGTGYGAQVQFNTLEQIIFHNVTAVPNDSSLGTVTGTGTYAHGSEVTLLALPNDGYLFEYWTEHDEILFDENNNIITETHTFIVEGDRALTAHFSEDAPAIQDVLVLDEHMHTGDTHICYDAITTIIAGGGSFIVENGAQVHLVAGHNIVFLPGSHIHQGACLNASITTDGSFCNEVEMKHSPIVLLNADSKVVEHTNHATDAYEMAYGDEEDLSCDESVTNVDHTGSSFFSIYPNPAKDAFTLKLHHFQTDETFTAEIYCIRGHLLKKIDKIESPETIIWLGGFEPGVHFIRVGSEYHYGIRKLVIH